MRIRIFYGLYILLGLSFIMTLQARPYPFAFLVKTVPIGLLTTLAFYNFKSVQGRLFSTALLFSCFGDVLLEIQFPGSFFAGLAAFSIAHIFYVLVFAREFRHSIPRIVVSALIVLFGLLLGDLLHLKLGNLLIPVLGYLGIITIMGVCAVMGRRNHPVTMLGAMVFIISDSIMAVNLFITDVSHSSHYVMSSYYLAQLLIFAGYHRGNRFGNAT